MGSSFSTSTDHPAQTHAASLNLSQPFLGFEPYVAAEEAAEFLKITPRRVKEMARAGIIPTHPVDPDAERKEWRFLLSELAVWMQDHARTRRRK